jgi:ASC-1-like (ASCH) protein
MIPNIPEGDFYDCSDGEQLQYTEPEEAVEYWLEGWLEPNCDVSAVIREQAPIELTVFKRNELEPGWVESQAERALDQVEQCFDDEYGNPNGTDPGTWTESRKKCFQAVVEAFKSFVTDHQIWRCDPIAKVMLDAEQIEEMMRAYNPDWWDDAKSLDSPVLPSAPTNPVSVPDALAEPHIAEILEPLAPLGVKPWWKH